MIPDCRKMKHKTKLTFKTYWQHAKKYKISMVATILFIVIGNVFSIIAPYWYKKFFDELVDSPEVSVLFYIISIIFVIGLLHWFFIRIASFTNAYFQTSVMRDLANTLALSGSPWRAIHKLQKCCNVEFAMSCKTIWRFSNFQFAIFQVSTSQFPIFKSFNFQMCTISNFQICKC